MTAELTPLFGFLWERPLLLVIGVFPLLHLWRSGRQRRLALATSPVFRDLGRGFGWARAVHVFTRCTFVASFVLAAVALAGPRAYQQGQQQRSGIDLVVALDLSTSMNALDLAGDDVLHRAMTLKEARMRTRIDAAACASSPSFSSLVVGAVVDF